MGEPRIIDNNQTLLVDELKQQITPSSKLSIAAASFSIYAYQALKEELENIEELRFIFTSPSFIADPTSKKSQREFFIPKLNRERSLYGSDFEIKLRNQLTQKAIAKECADWIRRKVRFKSNASDSQMGNYMNLQGDDTYTYLPFNDFTTPTLGIDKGNDLTPLVNRMPTPFSELYIKNFNDQWGDAEKFVDITDTILERIEAVYKENSPDFIYFVTLYNIFNEFLEDISEDVLPNEATGFKESAVWKKLYNFQRDASLAIINKLEKYNGCILADSVGLGKTFTALSVIKYYENRNKNVLVLCPKKLSNNWTTYKSNYKNNPLVADRLRYDVLFHTDLSRERGASNGIDLSLINWGNYDLIVIDESHNFRNGGKVTTDEEDSNPRQNRYLQLLEKVIKAGVKTKVLMLSATPVNNGFRDLKNQIALAYEGDSRRLDSLLNTHSTIEDIFRQAQTAYNRWVELPEASRTVEQLMKDLSFDFFEVLDSVTIARSRKHIQQYYDTTDIGTFPTRLKPISRRPQLTSLPQSTTVNYSDIYEILNTLNMSIYTPSAYILDSKKSKYNLDNDDEYVGSGSGLTRTGRESGLAKLMSINLLKRLESSVNSFALTLERIHTIMTDALTLIESFQSGDKSVSVNDYDTDNFDEESESFLVGGKKSRIELGDMDYLRWSNDIRKDLDCIDLLITMVQDITPEYDTKLQQLKQDIANKVLHPINKGNRKVIVFTAFADTAKYLYAQIAPWITQEFHLHTAVVSGTDDPKTTIKGLNTDFNTVLTYFSPQSKDRAVLYPKATEEIDILIATDCISEGQNLQDCDYLINYDIHWNPVRIIQRFGRIDRIGSRNAQIQLVNYWPDVELDEYINLKGRVESRMKITVLTSTGDDNLISEEEKGDLAYRRNQLKRLQEEVVDLEEMNTGINIMDLGLNEFRLDLLEYVKTHPDISHAPFGMSAVVRANELVKSGVIYVLKNRNNAINIANQNRLHPFYMVYVSNEGEVLCDHIHPKDMLDAMRSACKGQHEPDMKLCRQVNRETKDGWRMEHYSKLLQDAISSIVSVKAETDMHAFLLGQQNIFEDEGVKGLDDFELICFLIIK